MDVITHWGAIEADFQRFYNISNPHQEEYKRFLRLLVYMPIEESSFMKVMSNEQLDVLEDGTIIKKQNSDSYKAKMALRKQHNRDRKPREKISLDEFLGIAGGAK